MWHGNRYSLPKSYSFQKKNKFMYTASLFFRTWKEKRCTCSQRMLSHQAYQDLFKSRLSLKWKACTRCMPVLCTTKLPEKNSSGATQMGDFEFFTIESRTIARLFLVYPSMNTITVAMHCIQCYVLKMFRISKLILHLQSLLLDDCVPAEFQMQQWFDTTKTRLRDTTPKQYQKQLNFSSYIM